MKVASLFVALAATVNAFAPSSTFTPSTVSVNNARSGRSSSSLSMAMERTYIMVSTIFILLFVLLQQLFQLIVGASDVWNVVCVYM